MELNKNKWIINQYPYYLYQIIKQNPSKHPDLLLLLDAVMYPGKIKVKLRFNIKRITLDLISSKNISSYLVGLKERK